MIEPVDPMWWSPTLAAADDLAPVLAGRAAEVEQARHVPKDLVADLTAAGCFRMLVPADYGGDALNVGQALAVIETLSRADAAVGWNVMIAGSNLVVFGLFPRATFEAVYADGPDVISGGSHAPKGQAQPVAGGYRITGRWPFASGCDNCSWLVTHSPVVRDGVAELLDDGTPVMRLALHRAHDVEIIPDWHVLGLRGTGSHSIAVDDVFCPEERTCVLFGAQPTMRGTIFNIPPVAHLGLFIAAVALGIAQAAVDDLVSLLASGKRPAYGTRRAAESPLVQARLGEADATLRAARSLLYDQAARAWRVAAAADGFSLLDRARMRASSSRVVAMTAEVVEAAYLGGGGTALYDSSPLQRRLRDMYAVTQHAGVGPDFFPLVGALLAGEPIDPRRI
jgi:alkylation response protein AidB-like acyl-CoA dehydrogenase